MTALKIKHSEFSLIVKQAIQEANERFITERFGEPIEMTPKTVGISDDRSEDPVDEVAPPGMEDTVKGLKKDKRVDNPWAVAWSIHNKKKK